MTKNTPYIRTAALVACFIAAPFAQDSTTVLKTKATACFEKGGDFIRMVDAEGKKHRYSAFIIGDGTDTEWSDFDRSRKVVALDDGAKLTVKQGKDEQGNTMFAPMGEIKECPASKRAAFPKL